jgi:hypothetical protein
MSEATGWRKRQIVNKQEEHMNDFHDIQKRISTGVTSPWQWLTEEEIKDIAKWADGCGQGQWYLEFARAIHQKVKEKNT